MKNEFETTFNKNTIFIFNVKQNTVSDMSNCVEKKNIDW